MHLGPSYQCVPDTDLDLSLLRSIVESRAGEDLDLYGISFYFLREAEPGVLEFSLTLQEPDLTDPELLREGRRDFLYRLALAEFPENGKSAVVACAVHAVHVGDRHVRCWKSVVFDWRRVVVCSFYVEPFERPEPTWPGEKCEGEEAFLASERFRSSRPGRVLSERGCRVGPQVSSSGQYRYLLDQKGEVAGVLEIMEGWWLEPDSYIRLAFTGEQLDLIFGGDHLCFGAEPDALSDQLYKLRGWEKRDGRWCPKPENWSWPKQLGTRGTGWGNALRRVGVQVY